MQRIFKSIQRDSKNGLRKRKKGDIFPVDPVFQKDGMFCLFHKGRIAEGADADLTIFDPKIIIDGANYTDINILPKGISYVIQKGRVAVKDNCVVNEKLGEFISFAG